MNIFNLLKTNSNESTTFNEMKILYVQPKGFGDIIISTSIINALKEKYPLAKIDYQTEEGYDKILKNNPYINEIFLMNKNLNFEVYFQVLRPYIRTQKIPDWHKLGVHIVDLYALYAGVKINDYKTYIYMKPIVLKKLGIDDKKKLICIHPKSSDPMKDWPYFQDLINILKDNYQIILMGSKKDPSYKNVIDLKGKVNLQQLAFVISKCDLLIGIDSLGIHMAASLDIPTIILYGNTSAELCKPLSSNKITLIEPYRNGCREACHSGNCIKKDWCIKNITVEEVFNAAKKILKNGN